jgi:hypothetical protein
MTDDSTSISTVGDDEIGSSEDREVPPLSSTIKALAETPGPFPFLMRYRLRLLERELAALSPSAA